MWPRIILLIAGFLVVPAAKYVWSKVLENPNYLEEIERLNAKQAAKKTG